MGDTAADQNNEGKENIQLCDLSSPNYVLGAAPCIRETVKTKVIIFFYHGLTF